MSIANEKIGKVWLVGAGCGEADLITIRGLSVLKKCQAVIFDSLIDRRLLDLCPDSAEKICVGKRAGQYSTSQEEINALLVRKAQEGRLTARLKGGDPFVFGRGGEEITALKANNIPFEVVPGISSSIAVPEFAGIPVTHRKVSRSFHVITGHTAEDMPPEKLSVYAKLDGTLVLLMGLGNLGRITEGLIKGGMSVSTPAAVISNGGRVNQRTVRGTLGNITALAASEKLAAPAVTVIGETAAYDFSCADKRPLSGVSVAVTGTKIFCERLSESLSPLGAQVECVCALKITEYAENPEFDKALNELSRYTRIVLTSMNGAEIFLGRLRRLKIDIRRLSGISFAAIGEATARVLENVGIYPELVPAEFTSKALGEALSRDCKPGERVLILRAQKGSAELTEILSANNIAYDEIKTYDVESEKISGGVVESDFLVFASSSGAEAFFGEGLKISKKTKIVCIGEVTARTLKSKGVKNINISKVCSVSGITDAVLSEALK